ncbi:unnamed protein product [Blepharisma stoltei]|uniref:Uncharacterized protein n=1 Tax=Blepharisma stoltei TaxID=1481888 RepID=A0AAU9JYS5_9CILI|nr:unnamed protein product [Blepharisma stoltei]
MGDSRKKKPLQTILFPKPTHIDASVGSYTKRNPFYEARLPPLKTYAHDNQEEDSLLKELNTILSKPSISLPPLGKKTPSPGFVQKHQIERPPSLKINPIVHDEKFQELNSSLSTCGSSENSSFVCLL